MACTKWSSLACIICSSYEECIASTNCTCLASPRRRCVDYTIKFNLFWCVGDPRRIRSQDLRGIL
ncbi:hypothetical protein [Clostridium botulinum]|uniref:hypothetical protein n=1 Tax=Clostridium botulinum TaxID=1491 RepID=UPI003DA69FB8